MNAVLLDKNSNYLRLRFNDNIIEYHWYSLFFFHMFSPYEAKNDFCFGQALSFMKANEKN